MAAQSTYKVLVPQSAPALPKLIPGLDGLRAISILMVVVGHTAHTTNAPRIFGPASHLGNFGVKFFFVISGFLITTLLMRELDATGRISLKNFYIRRSLRIFPANYFYVAVIALLAALGFIQLFENDLLHAVTYTMNYHHAPLLTPGGEARTWYVNHLWSLSVEEQFYLLWPLTFTLTGLRHSRKFVWLAVVAAPLIRLAMYMTLNGEPLDLFTRRSSREFFAVCDALAIGCLLALNYNNLTQRRWAQRLASPIVAGIAGGALLLAAFASYYAFRPAYYIAGHSLATAGIAIFINSAVRSPLHWAVRPLNWSVLRFIGVLSYSMYLWQQFFLPSSSPYFFASFPQNVGFVFLASVFSYYCVERVFLRLKDRFHADKAGPARS